MRQLLRPTIILALLAIVGCAPSMGTVWEDPSDGGMPDNALPMPCSGLACRIADCPAGSPTTISGTVTIPAGTLPLPNVSVFVPGAPLAEINSGAECNRCDGPLSGEPIVHVLSDAYGNFKLSGVPSGDAIPLVIQAGKWRRQVTLLHVNSCTDNPVDPDLSRLPRHQGEGHLPKIALTTGEVDSLECLLRKIGIADSEFTPEYGSGRVNLYSSFPATDRYVDSLNGGATFTQAPVLWTQLPALLAYDVLALACEGVEEQTNKSPVALQAMQDYLNHGGRVFASHWHNYWVEFGPAPFPSIAVFNHRNDLPDKSVASIDTSFMRGAALADWLVQTGASTTRGALVLRSGKRTIESINPQLAQRWIWVPDSQSVQYLSFNAPVGADEKAQCGRMVLTDIHIANNDSSATLYPFPTGCTSVDFSPQEKALIYMFFDLSNCLQPVIG